MIHISPAAVKEIKRLESKQLDQNLLFRLQVKAGGCSGLFYNMTFENAVDQDERVLNCNGISVVVDVQSLNYLKGLTLDYSEDLMGGGFRFHNPNATSSCGCGNSFTTSV